MFLVFRPAAAVNKISVIIMLQCMYNVNAGASAGAGAGAGGLRLRRRCRAHIYLMLINIHLSFVTKLSNIPKRSFPMPQIRSQPFYYCKQPLHRVFN